MILQPQTRGAVTICPLHPRLINVIPVDGRASTAIDTRRSGGGDGGGGGGGRRIGNGCGAVVMGKVGERTRSERGMDG